MNIHHDNIYAYVDNPPDDIKAILVDGLKYHPAGYEHQYNYTSGRWDGYEFLYNTKNNSFRVGLLERVGKILKSNGVTVDYKYIGKSAPTVRHQFMSGNIRPYDFQDEAVDAGIDNSVGLIVSPTGSGKGIIISKLIKQLYKKTMVIVVDIVLLDQMIQVLQKYFDQPIGMIGDGEFDLQNITVTTIQSLASMNKPSKNIKAADKKKALLQHVEDVGVVLSDEAHLSSTQSFEDVMPLFKNATKFIGLSATPFGWSDKSEKRQNLELEQHFGQVIFDSRKLDFVDLKLKVPIVVNIVAKSAVSQLYNKHTKRASRGRLVPDHGKNYRDCLVKELLENEEYHTLIAKTAWNLNAQGKTVFVHAAHSIEFGEKICKLIPGAILINGATPRLERRAAYDAIRRRELLTIVSDVGSTGLDIPNLDAIILGSDLVDVRQIVGRVSRAAPNKTHGMVYDIRVGTPFLLSHYEKRLAQYNSMNATILGEE